MIDLPLNCGCDAGPTESRKDRQWGRELRQETRMLIFQSDKRLDLTVKKMRTCTAVGMKSENPETNHACLMNIFGYFMVAETKSKNKQG